MRAAASLTALLTSFVAGAQDFPDEPPKPPSKAGAAGNRPPSMKLPDFDVPTKAGAKSAPSPSNSKCPEGPPEAILKYMADSLQVTADETNPVEVRSAFREAFNAILTAGDKVVRHASATETQKNEAYQYQASILYQGARKGELGYADRLDRLAETLFRTQPKSDVANLAHFLSVKSRYEDDDGLRPDAIPAIKEYLKNFPREEAAIELLLDAAASAESDGKNAAAKDAIVVIQQQFKKHEIAPKIPAMLTRLELVGKRPSLEVALMDGKKFNIDDRRRKVVVVAYWATWCEPWLADQQILKDLYGRYKSEGLEIVGVPLDEKETTVHQFLTKHGVNWPQVVIPFEAAHQGFNHPIAKQYGVMQAPTIFLVEDGKVVATQIRGQALKRKIEEAITKTGASTRIGDRTTDPPPFK